MVEEKKRGWFLTIWLILMLISNALITYNYLLNTKLKIILLKSFSSWSINFLGIIAILGIIFTILLFFWKKWAFYGFCGTAIIVFVINLTIGIDFIQAILGLAGPIILYFIIRPKWDLFE